VEFDDLTHTIQPEKDSALKAEQAIAFNAKILAASAVALVLLSKIWR